MAVLMTPPYMEFCDDDGNPLSGGKVYTYSAGTTTPKATYTTQAGTVQNTNPVILDASGRAVIFIDGSYKFTITDSADVVIRTVDNVSSFTVAQSSNDITALTEETPALVDYMAFSDTSDSGLPKKATIQDILALQSGSIIKIKSVTASNSTSIDFVNGSSGVVLDGTYGAYMVIFESIVPSSDDVAFYMRTSTDTGSTYDSGASDYAFSINGSNEGGSKLSSGASGASKVSLSIANLGTGTGEKYNGKLTIFRPSAAEQTHIEFSYTFKDLNGMQAHGKGGAVRLASANVDAFRFYMSSDNIATGTITLYGVVT